MTSIVQFSCRLSSGSGCCEFCPIKPPPARHGILSDEFAAEGAGAKACPRRTEGTRLGANAGIPGQPLRFVHSGIQLQKTAKSRAIPQAVARRDAWDAV